MSKGAQIPEFAPGGVPVASSDTKSLGYSGANLQSDRESQITEDTTNEDLNRKLLPADKC